MDLSFLIQSYNLFVVSALVSAELPIPIPVVPADTDTGIGLSVAVILQ